MQKPFADVSPHVKLIGRRLPLIQIKNYLYKYFKSYCLALSGTFCVYRRPKSFYVIKLREQGEAAGKSAFRRNFDRIVTLFRRRKIIAQVHVSLRLAGNQAAARKQTGSLSLIVTSGLRRKRRNKIKPYSGTGLAVKNSRPEIPATGKVRKDVG